MKIFHQSTFDRWPFDDKSIQAIITSPPYYSLRKYDIPDIIIGGNPVCEHEWGVHLTKKTSNNYNANFNERWGNSAGAKKQEHQAYGEIQQGSFCLHCSAWKGQYGLEPTYKLYIEHTLLWCREAMRVLRDDGVFFLNLGDSYSGNRQEGTMKMGNPEFNKNRPCRSNTILPARHIDLTSKCLLDIPSRVSIALVDELGLIKRNNIVWYSPNKMPESVTDRFSKKHEMIFMFSKRTKYYFDLDAVREVPTTMQLGEYNPAKDTDKIAVIMGDGIKTNNIRGCHSKGKNPGDVWLINTQPSPEAHYAMWPEKLCERLMLCSTKAGDAVLDPFCGSGTTLRVADKLNRVAYGIDLGYGDIQSRRLSQIQREIMFERRNNDNV